MKQICSAIIILVAVLCFNYVSALIVGSNSAVSIQNNIVFPSTDSNNTMLGYAAFSNGFALASASTVCTFSAYFPVSETIDLRGGRFNLQTDLTLESPISFLSTGSIIGNNHVINFPNQTLTVPSSATYSLVPIATSNVGAVVNSISWSFDSNYLAEGVNNTGSNNNVVVQQFNGTTITTLNGYAGGVNVFSVNWHPSLYWIVATATGFEGTLSYVPGTNTLTLVAFAATPGSVNGTAVAFAPIGTFFAAGGAGFVQVNSFNTGTGAFAQVALDTASAKQVQNNCLSWDPTSNYFAIGSSNSPQLTVYQFTSPSTLAINATNAVGNTVSAVSWSPNSNLIAVGLTGGSNNLRIFQFSSGTITDLVASHVGETQNVLGIDWSPDGQNIVVGLSTGSGTEIRTYAVNTSTGVLTLEGAVSSAFNNNAVSWSPNGSYIAGGDSNSIATVYQSDLVPLTLQNVKVVLNGNTTFVSPVLCSGTVVIEGNNYTLDLTSSPSFTINPSASVLFKNLTLNGISNSNLNCFDNTGVIKLQNVTLIQNGNYTFSKGAFTVDGDCMITGSSLFIYGSSQTSTINSNAILMFDAGMTFSYISSTNNKLAYTDSTGILYFNQATLYASAVGFALTKGILTINGACTLLNDGATLAGGVSIGDGANAANDITFRILPESGLNIKSGFFVQKNV